jgi:hypothetical protein
MVRMYENNEVHECESCGLLARVTFAAVPIDPVTCCGKIMVLKGIIEDDSGFDLAARSTEEKSYKPGGVWSCDLCGIEMTILRQALPKIPLDCCGQGMELLR